MRYLYIIQTLILLCITSVCFAYSAFHSAIGDTPPEIGNFALPVSQQPGPLVGFGQTVINKGAKQLYLYSEYYKGVNQHYLSVVPYFVYGVSDYLAVSIEAPIAVSYVLQNSHSAGWQDVPLAVEYAFYTHSNHCYSDQATILASILLPTGSGIKFPATGFGSTSYFIGGTFNRQFVDWFMFTSDGVLFPTAHNGTKFGNQFLYQVGVGRNILTIGKQWLVALMAEGSGQYAQKNEAQGIYFSNTGGNTFYIVPSIWVSSQRMIFQFGAGVPVIQHLFGHQLRENYLLVTSMGLTF